MSEDVKSIENSDVWLTRWVEHNNARLREFAHHCLKLNCEKRDIEKAAGFEAAVIAATLEPVVVALVTSTGGNRECLHTLLMQTQLALVKASVQMFEQIKSDQKGKDE